MLFAALAAALVTGCQTRITATKNPESAHPIQRVVQVNGQDQVIVASYQVTSGGWEATARSPLYATEALDGLTIEVKTNGTVSLNLNRYDRDLSTNAVQMTDHLISGGVNLISSIGTAYAKIAGGGLSTDAIMAVAQKAYSVFADGGGNVDNATVTSTDSTVRITDGSVCVECSPDGTCTSCTP